MWSTIEASKGKPETPADDASGDAYRPGHAMPQRGTNFK
jgi:hypothetical protein